LKNHLPSFKTHSSSSNLSSTSSSELLNDFGIAMHVANCLRMSRRLPPNKVEELPKGMTLHDLRRKFEQGELGPQLQQREQREQRVQSELNERNIRQSLGFEHKRGPGQE
jgi:hypothetical protein